MVGKVGGGFDHAPGVAGRADAPAFTGIGNQIVVAAVGAAGPSEAVGEDAAFQIAAEFPLDVGGRGAARFVLRQFEPGRQVGLHGAIEHRALGLAATIGDCALAHAAAKAEAQQDSLSEALDSTLSTKADIVRLKSRIETLELRLSIKLGGIIAITSGVIVAIMRLPH